jgi:hypothetical protein
MCNGSLPTTTRRSSLRLEQVEDRLFEVRSDPANRREIIELQDAKHTIVLLQEHEQQTRET